MNRFRFTDNGLQRINAQGKNVGQVYNIDDPQAEIILKNIDNPNSDFELVDETRMAADAILDKYKGDYEKAIASEHAVELATQDAIAYINKRAPELDAMGLLQGGRKLGKASEIVANLDRLQGDVPMPIIKNNKDGTRTRTHTQYAINDITGQEQVVGYMDPNSPDEVLKSVFGTSTRKVLSKDSRGNPEFQRGDEEVAENVMKLMGNQTMPRGHGGLGLSDLQSGGKNVDVMMRPSYTDNALLPAFTALRTADAGRKNADSIASEMDTLIKHRMNRNGGNLMAAVDELRDQGRLDNSFTPNMMLGKIGRADSNRISSERELYDELIMPGYNKEVMNIDTKSPEAPKYMTIEPNSIHKVDLKGALDYLQSGVKPQQLKVMGNYGAEGGGLPRAQAKVRIPLNESFIEDVTVTHPMTQQMLAMAELNKRKIPS